MIVVFADTASQDLHASVAEPKVKELAAKPCWRRRNYRK